MEVPQLYVKILEARDLPKEARRGQIQCILQLEPFELRGSFAKNSWTWKDDQFVFEVREHDGELNVLLVWYDSEAEVHASQRPNTILGVSTVPLKKLYNEQPLEDWFVLEEDTREETEKQISKSSLKMLLHYSYSVGTHFGASLILDTNKSFVQMLVEPHLEVVSALCSVCDISDSQKIATSLVNVFEYYKWTPHLLKSVIENEVNNTNSEGVLFRSNSMAMKMVSVYARLVGQIYLQDVLGPIIREICLDSKSMEMDPVRVKNESELETNAQHLLAVCDNFLNRICQTIDRCPVEIRLLCKTFKDMVSARFPKSWYQAVGGFLFLRFLCPACVAPDGYNILEVPPSPESRRALVLVTKTLQNLASGVEFGGKEVYMARMNTFIASNLSKLHTYFEEIANVSNAEPPQNNLSIRSGEALEHLNQIHHYLKLYLPKMTTQWKHVKDVPIMVETYKMPTTTPVNKLHNISNERLQKRGAIRIQDFEVKPKAMTNLLKKTGLEKVLFGYIEEEEIVINASPKSRSFGASMDSVLIGTLNRPLEAPYPLSVDLINRLLSMYIKHSFYTSKTKCVTNWSELASTDEYKRFVADTGKLCWVDLSVMSPPEQIAFWINVSNTLAIHVQIISKGLPRQRSHTYTYNIGGDKYSLKCIRHGILRGNAKQGVGRVFQPADRRAKNVTPRDPRVHFALSYLTVSSPIINIMSAETLEEDLQSAGCVFCREHVEVNLAKREIALPELFHKYSSDFGQTKEEILIWLFQFLDDQKRINLLSLMEMKADHISYKPHDYSPQTPKTNSKLLPRVPSKKKITTRLRPKSIAFSSTDLLSVHDNAQPEQPSKQKQKDEENFLTPHGRRRQFLGSRVRAETSPIGLPEEVEQRRIQRTAAQKMLNYTMNLIDTYRAKNDVKPGQATNLTASPIPDEQISTPNDNATGLLPSNNNSSNFLPTNNSNELLSLYGNNTNLLPANDNNTDNVLPNDNVVNEFHDFPSENGQSNEDSDKLGNNSTESADHNLEEEEEEEEPNVDSVLAEPVEQKKVLRLLQLVVQRSYETVMDALEEIKAGVYSTTYPKELRYQKMIFIAQIMSYVSRVLTEPMSQPSPFQPNLKLLKAKLNQKQEFDTLLQSLEKSFENVTNILHSLPISPDSDDDLKQVSLVLKCAREAMEYAFADYNVLKMVLQKQ